MQAVVVRDGGLFLEERETPSPGPGDVLVAVRSAGINAADLLQRAGLYPAPAGSPADIPGLELAGMVEHWGDGVSGFAVGDRVCAVVGGGAQATHCVVPAEHLIRVPKGIEITSVGAFPEGFSTAHDALVTQAKVSTGDRVLITGAAGGVGTAAIQVASVMGATPIALVRDRRHEERLRNLGALEVITMDEVADLEPVDVVLELIGAASLEHVQRRLRPHARVVVIGVSAGSKMEIDLLNVMTKRVVVTGSTLRSRSRAEKAEVARRVQSDLIGLLESNRVHVPLAANYHLRDVHDAYNAFAASGKFGKIVLTNG